MIMNISRGIVDISVIAMAVIAILCLIGLVIMFIRGTRCKRIIMLTSLSFILIAATSWITNLGWIRFYLAVCLVPLAHAIVVFITNMTMVPYIEKYNSFRVLNAMFCITYIVANMMFPDSNGIDAPFFFFGKIQGESPADIAQTVAIWTFFCHVFLFVSQVVLALVFDAKKKDEDAIGTDEIKKIEDN